MKSSLSRVHALGIAASLPTGRERPEPKLSNMKLAGKQWMLALKFLFKHSFLTWQTFK